MQLLNSVAGWLGYQKRVPPKVPPERVSVRPEALAWAKRNVERVRAAVAGGRLRMPSLTAASVDETAAMRRLYPKMIVEPSVNAAVRATVDSVAALDLQITPEDRADPRQQEQAEFVRHAFRKVDGGRLKLCRNVAVPAIMRGWSCCEKVWHQESAGRYAGKWRWKAWKSKDTEGLDLETDAYANVTGVVSRIGDEGVYDPGDFVIYSYQQLWEDPAGIAAFRVAYRDWQAKQFAVELWGLGLEKWGFPFLVATHDLQPGSEKIAALEAALEASQSNTWMTVSEGIAVEAMAAATSGPGNWQQFVAERDKGILIAIMGSHLAVMEGSQANVAGNSETQRSTAELYQWALATELSQIFTREAAELCRINYSGVPAPEVSLGAVSERDISVMLANDSALHALGLPLSRQSLYQRTGREPPRDDGDALAGASPLPPTPSGPPAYGFADDGRLAEPSKPPPKDSPARSGDVALAGADGRQAADLLRQAKDAGESVLGQLVRSAVERLVSSGDASLRAAPLFTGPERQELADALAATVATADLLGAVRVRDRLAAIRDRGLTLHAEDATPFEAFADGGGVPLMAPADALAYFRGLTPGVKARIDPAKFVDAMNRRAFTLAEATEQGVVNQVRQLLQAYLEGRDGPSLTVAGPGGQPVTFRPHSKSLDRDVQVIVPVDRVDAAWKGDSGYVPPGGGGTAVPGRREGFERFLTSGRPVESPLATIGDDGVLSFTDGRSRFSVLRDGGAKAVALTIPESQLPRFQSLGARLPGMSDLNPVAAVNAALDAAGVSPRNPQYADMVVRTNMMSAYNDGATAELQDQDVIDEFPVWLYLGIKDGRQGKDHEPKFGRYYPSSASFADVRGPRTASFADVRGPRTYNCRCTFAPIYRIEWQRLQAGGAKVSAF